MLICVRNCRTGAILYNLECYQDRRYNKLYDQSTGSCTTKAYALTSRIFINPWLLPNMTLEPIK